MAPEIIDSYSESNFSTGTSIISLHPTTTGYPSAAGQSFTCINAAKITSAKFYLKKVGSPSGDMHAVLYTHDGTYGTSSLPTGEPLSTSDDVAISGLTTEYQLITFAFSGAQQYEMSAATSYCITWENCTSGTMDDNNHPYIGEDRTSPTHGGNHMWWYSSAWAYINGWDCIFYVYGETAATGTNTQINIGDSWKDIDAVKVNVGDSWKAVASVKVNVGDSWKEIF